MSVALVANGWVLLLGHGLAQIACLCRGAGHSREATPDFSGWASPTVEFPGPTVRKEGRDNGSFENDGADRKGERRGEWGLRERKKRERETQTHRERESETRVCVRKKESKRASERERRERHRKRDVRERDKLCEHERKREDRERL